MAGKRIRSCPCYCCTTAGKPGKEDEAKSRAEWEKGIRFIGGLGDAASPVEVHAGHARRAAKALHDYANMIPNQFDQGFCGTMHHSGEQVEEIGKLVKDLAQDCHYHVTESARLGLGDGCRDERGFVPVPACIGYEAAKATREHCPYGVNRNTGKCLKHPRKKRR